MKKFEIKKFGKKNGIALLCFALLLLVSFSSFAEEVVPSTTSAAPPPQESHPKKVKGRLPREKEAEGSQAPNRFDTDIVIKSKYDLNGQSLEVDTD